MSTVNGDDEVDADAEADRVHQLVQSAGLALPTSLDTALDVLARTLYGEARGYPNEGKYMVASVIMNRAANPRWWGNGVVGVCRKPWQFSCWNAGDPNLPKLLAASHGDPAFDACYSVAKDAIMGIVKDATGGADSYFDTSIPTPAWAKDRTPTATYQDFRFYRVELPPLT